jgi:hypothetical protein
LSDRIVVEAAAIDVFFVLDPSFFWRQMF